MHRRAGTGYGTNADAFSANAQTQGQIGPGLVLSLDGSYSDQSDYEIDGFANEEAEEEGIDGFLSRNGRPMHKSCSPMGPTWRPNSLRWAIQTYSKRRPGKQKRH